jgi:hypothetical protein
VKRAEDESWGLAHDLCAGNAGGGGLHAVFYDWSLYLQQGLFIPQLHQSRVNAKVEHPKQESIREQSRQVQ